MKEPHPLDIALDARAKDIAAIPCHPGMKVPMVPWKRWQAEMPPLKLQRAWFADPDVNVAIICSGMAVFDCDDPDMAELVVKHCGDTPHKVRTPRGGVHLGYRLRMGVTLGNSVKIKGLPIDIRTYRGVEVIPNSATEHGRYEWLSSGLRRVSELPYGNVGWTRERVRKRAASTMAVEPCDPGSIVWRGRRYVDRFERRAVSGQGGHTAMFVNCLKICGFVKKLGGSEKEAWQLILYCNATKCDPPWDPSRPDELAALRHKLDDAMKKSR